MNIIFQDDPIGYFCLELNKEYQPILYTATEHDRQFIKIHLRYFLLAMLSTLTSSSGNRKIKRKIITKEYLEILKDRLGIILIKDELAGDFQWTLLKKYSCIVSQKTTPEDRQDINDFINVFILLMSEVLKIPDRQERLAKKNLMHDILNEMEDKMSSKNLPPE